MHTVYALAAGGYKGCAPVSTHQTVYLKWGPLIVYKLHLCKVHFQRKKNTERKYKRIFFTLQGGNSLPNLKPSTREEKADSIRAQGFYKTLQKNEIAHGNL